MNDSPDDYNLRLNVGDHVGTTVNLFCLWGPTDALRLRTKCTRLIIILFILLVRKLLLE